MNRTLEITNPLISDLAFSRSNHVEALRYFEGLYDGIQYDEINDSFLYRGFTFDYFLSGMSALNSNINTYMLIFNSEWLFIYGDLEERWNEFIERMNNYEVIL